MSLTVQNIDILQRYTPTGSERLTGLADAAKKLWMMLEPVLKPVILVPETDQNASGFPVASDYNLGVRGHPQIAGEIIFDLGESDLTLRLAHTARAMLRLLLSRRSRGFGLLGR